MAEVRSAAVAGTFYPEQGQSLRAAIDRYLEDAREAPAPSRSRPKALIVPHAGYVYSGPIAARAYACLEAAAGTVRRVILLGPSHRVPFAGLAVPSHASFQTPLGAVPVDAAARDGVLELPFVHTLDDAHRFEHSLEVQLPFLQQVLESFAVLPIAVGRASGAQVKAALDALWGGEETLVLISSDLSHYHDYETARRKDAATANAIEHLEPERLGPEDACGCIGIQGLLHAARERGLVGRRLDLRSSGDTAGDRHHVVGYGAWAFTASSKDCP